MKKLVHRRNLLFIVSMLFVIQFSLLMPHGIVNAQNEEYSHVLTLESPNPVENAWFGARVKINGEIVAISERYSDVDDALDAGVVYIYDTDGNLKFTLQSPLPQATGGFGWELDIFNDTIVISEPRYIVEDRIDVGKAHIFTIDGTYKLSLQPPEVISGNNFGLGIGGHDDVIVIAELSSEGKVHLFDNEGTYLKSLLSPSPKVGGKFGGTVEVGETLILLGEHGTSSNPRGPGSVYMFDHDGNHLMTLQAPEPEDQARFGKSISISGDRIVIGESFATVNEVFRAGKVYIYNTDGEHLQTLESPNPKLNGRFGDDVAIDGDRVVVGEGFADVNPLRYEGRAYVFDIDGNLLQNLTAPQPCLRGAFGLSVDIEGDTIVISEAWAATEDLGQAGRAHIFRLGEAIFELSNLAIEPESVNVGESVTVSVDVANVGTLSGTYPAKLMIDGDMVEEKTVTVDVGLSETVTFTYQTDDVGTYSVEIEDLEGSFKVEKPIIPGFPIAAIVLGLIFTIIFLTQRKR